MSFARQCLVNAYKCINAGSSPCFLLFCPFLNSPVVELSTPSSLPRRTSVARQHHSVFFELLQERCAVLVAVMHSSSAKSLIIFILFWLIIYYIIGSVSRHLPWKF